ncbi:EEIG1/EHBP1 N-terminal domain-containing protein [Tanacetum coccineum]
MATEPNDVRLHILMKLREEFDMEAALEEEMVNLFHRFLERIRLCGPEIISSSLQPNINLPKSPIHPFGGENAVRIIPSPAGILQATKHCKTAEIKEGDHDYEILTRVYVRIIIEDASEDDHFIRDTWLSAVQYLVAKRGIAIGCFGDMKTSCTNGKFEEVVALIKSCTPNALGELTVTLKDPSGIIHHKVLS